jgi:cytochrome c oxidase subunit IV
MESHEEIFHHENHGDGSAQRRRIWVVFAILALITTIEFVIAFVVDRGFMRNSVFIGMTLVKAAYIVAEFMHLKHEVKRFMYMILLPMLFVCWLILAMLMEATFKFYGWFGQ